MHLWMDGWIDGCMYGWMDVWMDGCMDVYMYLCTFLSMHGWMDVCMYVDRLTKLDPFRVSMESTYTF